MSAEPAGGEVRSDEIIAVGEPSPAEALFDLLLAHVVVPAALIGAVGAFLFFLIDLRAAFLPGGGALRWVGGFFVTASVLIARYSHVYGNRDRSRAYRVALFVASYVSMSVLTGHGVGPILPWAGSAADLAGLWAVHRLATALTAQSSLDRDDDPHGNPARGIARVSVGALVVFALGEPILLSAAPALGRQALGAVIVFSFSAGMLLSVGSLAGTARHVRRRGGVVAGSLLPLRAAVGAVLLVFTLSAALAIPGVRFEGSGGQRPAGSARDATHAGIEYDDPLGEKERLAYQGEPSARDAAKGAKSSERGDRGGAAGAGGGLVESLADLGGLLVWVVYAIAIALAVYGLWRFARGAAGKGGAFLEWLRRLFRRRPRAASPDRREPPQPLVGLDTLPPELAVRVAYGRFLEIARILGHPRSEPDTALQFLERLPPVLRPVAAQAEVLTALFQRAAYSQETTTLEDRAQAMVTLRAIEEQLAQSAT